MRESLLRSRASVGLGMRLTLALLASTAAISVSGVCLPAMAQGSGVVAYAVPAGPLDSAIIRFGERSGLQILYPADLVRGKQSPGVSGAFTPNEALARLLAGSNLTFQYTAANTVTIVPLNASANTGIAPDGTLLLGTLTVTDINPNSTMTPLPAYAGGQVATGGQLGMLGNRSVMNTPFSQTSYTNQTIENQQANTIQDVLTNNSSVVVNTTNGAGSFYEGYLIRGFSGSGGFGGNEGTSLNGLTGIAPRYATDTGYMERVEVLLGPSALLNGIGGGIGGSVALVTKQAGDEPLTRLTTRYESDTQFGAHVDYGRRIGEDKQFGLRFNGSVNSGDTAISPQSIVSRSAALNADYRGERVRFSTDFIYQKGEVSPMNMGAVGLPSELYVPAPPDAGTSLYPDWSESGSESTAIMARAEVDLTENLIAHAAVGWQRTDYSYSGAFLPYLIDNTGLYRFLDHDKYLNVTDAVSVRAGFRGTVATGPVDHAFSIDFSRRKTRLRLSWLNAPAGFTFDPTDLYDPQFGSGPSYGDMPDLAKRFEDTYSSVALADTLSFMDGRLQSTIALRYQNSENDVFDLTNGDVTSHYDESAVTPAFTILYKARENLSLYANYIEDLRGGTVVNEFYANEGEVFKPYVSKQYEVGAKLDLGAVTTTLAAFEIRKQDTVSVEDPDGGLPTLALNGEQRNRGIELNAYGEVRDGLRLMGGATFLDARLTRTQGGAQDGFRAAAVPKFRSVLGLEWDTPSVEGLTLTGRVEHTGPQLLVSDQDLEISSWTTLDLGARYMFESNWTKKPVTIRLNVDNVFDRDYWASAGTILHLGAPRTVSLSATMDF